MQEGGGASCEDLEKNEIVEKFCKKCTTSFNALQGRNKVYF